MPNLLEKITDLKNRIENLRSEIQRAKGAFDQITQQMYNEFNCSAEKAQRKLKQLQDECIEREEKIKQITEELETELDQYE